MLTLTVWMVVTKRTVAALLVAIVLQMSSNATIHYANLVLGNVMGKTTVETTLMRIQMSAESSTVHPQELSAARTTVSVCSCQRGAMASITVEIIPMK